MQFSQVARVKIYGFGARVGSSASVVMVEIAEGACDEAMRLFAAYSAASTAYHGASGGPAKKKAMSVLFRARRLHREHAQEHGCSKATSVKPSPNCGSP